MADSPRAPIHHDLIGFEFNASIVDRDLIVRWHKSEFVLVLMTLKFVHGHSFYPAWVLVEVFAVSE